MAVGNGGHHKDMYTRSPLKTSGLPQSAVWIDDDNIMSGMRLRWQVCMMMKLLFLQGYRNMVETWLPHPNFKSQKSLV